MKKYLLSAALAAIAQFAVARTAYVYDVIRNSSGVLMTSEANSGFTYNATSVKIADSSTWGAYYTYGISVKGTMYYAFPTMVHLDMSHNVIQDSGKYGSYTRTCGEANSPSPRYLYTQQTVSSNINLGKTLEIFYGDSNISAAPALESYCLSGNWDRTTSSSVWQESYTVYQCTITYHSGFDGQTSTQNFRDNENFTLNAVPQAFKRAGYTFKGWSETANGTTANLIDGATISAGRYHNDLELWGVWEAASVTVNLDPDGGSCVSSIGVTYGGTYKDLPNPEPPSNSHVSFKGWYTAANGGGTKVTQATTVNNPNDHTLYACWENVKVTIDFLSDGGNPSSFQVKDVVWDEQMPDVSASTLPTKTGQSLTGYWNMSGTKQYYDETGKALVKSDFYEYAELKAHWTNNWYQVHLHPEGGENYREWTSVEFSQTIKNLQASDMPAKTGYTFTGYFSSTSGGSKFVDADGHGTRAWGTAADGDLYAQWTENSYTLYLHRSDSDSNPKSSGSHKYTAQYNLPAISTLEKDGFVKEECKFAGWKTNPAATEPTYADAAMVSKLNGDANGEAHLYACWTLDPKFSLTLDGNGGKFGGKATTNVVCIQNEPYADLPTPFLSSDYEFAGWWTEKGTTNAVCAGEQRRLGMTADRTKTLYARWKVVKGPSKTATFTYKLTKESTVDAKGKKIASTNVNYTVGEALGELPKVYCDEGWMLFGWYTAPSGGVQVTERTIAESNFTAYARCGMKNFNEWTGLKDVAIWYDGECGWTADEREKFRYRGRLPIGSDYRLEDEAGEAILYMQFPAHGKLELHYHVAGDVGMRLKVSADDREYDDICQDAQYGVLDWDSHIYEAEGSYFRIKYGSLTYLGGGGAMLAGFEFEDFSENPMKKWDSLVDDMAGAVSLSGVDGWTVTDKVKAAGTNGLVAEKVPDARFTELCFKTNEAGRVRFMWRTSCEQGYYDAVGVYHETDYLEVRTNGVSVARIDGVREEFSQYSFWVPADCEVSWRYVKDTDGAGGEDKAWLDEFTFTPTEEREERGKVTFSVGDHGKWTDDGKTGDREVELIVDNEGMTDASAAAPNVSGESGGWRFLDWGEGVTLTKVRGGAKLTARYECKVTFVVDGAKGEASGAAMEQWVQVGGSATAPDVAGIDDYTFESWNASYDNVQGPVTVTAVFKDPPPVTYSADFVIGKRGVWKDDGTSTARCYVVTASSNTGFADASKVVPDVGAAADGWRFRDWGENADLTKINCDTNFTARYECKVTFVVDSAKGKTAGAELEQWVPVGGDATAPTVTGVNDYTYSSWDASYKNVQGPITVTAQFNDPASVSYSVTFSVGAHGAWADGGQSDKIVTVSKGGDATPPDVAQTVNGWSFKGWVGSYTKVQQDQTVTAQYVQDTNTGDNQGSHSGDSQGSHSGDSQDMYTVRFEPGEHGTVGSGQWVQQVAQGSAATAPTPIADEGWVFIGWSGDFQKVTGDLTIVAQYRSSGGGLTPVVDEEPDFSVANVYDGYAFDADGSVVATVQAKSAKTSAGKQPKITATVVLASTGRNLSFKGGLAGDDGVVSDMTAGGMTLRLVLGYNGMSGTLDDYEISGSRAVLSAKDDYAKMVTEYVYDNLDGSYNAVWTDDEGMNVLCITIASKGKVKISGTMSNGSKVSSSAQLCIGENGHVNGIPVVITKKVGLSFMIWFTDADAEGSGFKAYVTGMDGVMISPVSGLNERCKVDLDVDGLKEAFSSEGLTGLLSDYLPDELPVEQSGTKWVVADGWKTGKLVLDKTTGEVNTEKSNIERFNVSGLKLTYTAKTGAYKGSFKVYYVYVNGRTYSLKSVSATVTGIVLDGIGYGTATMKVGKTKRVFNMQIVPADD